MGLGFENMLRRGRGCLPYTLEVCARWCGGVGKISGLGTCSISARLLAQFAFVPLF